jgi:hypothetical protein
VLLSKMAVFFALLFFPLQKQKCVSKSLTEAELVALSDKVSFVEGFDEFYH